MKLKDDSLMNSEPGTLYTGDYSIKGLEHIVTVERKSLDDLMGCIGQHRERFEKEIDRLRAYECKTIVVESTWEKIEKGDYRSRINPSAAIGSIMGWIARGIPVTMCGNAERAGIFTARFLWICANRRMRELRSITND